ncbi:unnamed protein product [Protopolystoma xenopodis]|uniref:Uncharacterized protein n=1 Tax=Protopolystoma xenopodis TaxID=117903 RepID=A0A448WZU0_9PLAT|nr:unnamed protein product [Protopolystoma xenopodis]
MQLVRRLPPWPLVPSQTFVAPNYNSSKRNTKSLPQPISLQNDLGITAPSVRRRRLPTRYPLLSNLCILNCSTGVPF